MSAWKELSAPGTLRAPTLALASPAMQPFVRVSPVVRVFTCEPCAAEHSSGAHAPHDATFNVYYITRDGKYARVSCCCSQLPDVIEAVCARSRERVLAFEAGFSRGAGAA